MFSETSNNGVNAAARSPDTLASGRDEKIIKSKNRTFLKIVLIKKYLKRRNGKIWRFAESRVDSATEFAWE